jgi:peptidyl-prolyl cis-trans isomerase C
LSLSNPAPRAPAASRQIFPRAVLLTLALAGCHGGSAPKSSQVMATVNDHEITVNQLNQVLAAQPPEAVSPVMRQQAMDSLVDEELLVEEATKHKLDRQPTVVQAIEKAKRQILARAYAESSIYARSPPTTVEVEQYYRDNPILFAARKLFRVTAFAIPRISFSDSLKTELNKLNSTEQVREMLDKHGLEYETQFLSIAPEQVPIDRLPLFAKSEVGNVLTVEQSDGKEQIMTVTEIHEAPISLERARPMIRQFLINNRQKEALAAYLKQSKSRSKIVYLKDLSDPQARDSNAALTAAPGPSQLATAKSSGSLRD